MEIKELEEVVMDAILTRLHTIFISAYGSILRLINLK